MTSLTVFAVVNGVHHWLLAAAFVNFAAKAAHFLAFVNREVEAYAAF